RAVPEPIADERTGTNQSSTTTLVIGACTASPQSKRMAVTAGLRLPAERLEFGRCLKDESVFYADIEALLQDGSHQSAARARILAEGGAITCCAVPLRAGERTVGVLQSICTRPAGFTGEQLQLLYLVADLLGPAMSNSQLFHRLSAAYEELRKTQ